MALITVNGVVLPTPSDYQVGIQDLSKSERNANGTLIMELIATKRKIELGWSALTQSEMSQILKSVKGGFFTVTYFDPEIGGNKTGTFYAGDRQSPILMFKNGVPTYKDLKFNIIER